MSYFKKFSKKRNIRSKKYKKKRNTRKIYRKGGMVKNTASAIFRGTKTVGSEIAKDQFKRKMKETMKNNSVPQSAPNLNRWNNQTNLINPNLQTFNPNLQTFNPNLQTFNI